MGTIEIKKIERKVTVGKKGEQRQQVQESWDRFLIPASRESNNLSRWFRDSPIFR